MIKINKTIDFIRKFVTLCGRVIKEPKNVLTLKMPLFFSSIEFKKVNIL